MRSLGFTWLDAVALIWFFAWWTGYARFAAWHGERVPSLLSAMAHYRRDWWARMIERELRVIDTSIITNLANSSTFFASTALLILSVLVGAAPKVPARAEDEAEFIDRAWRVSHYAAEHFNYGL